MQEVVLLLVLAMQSFRSPRALAADAERERSPVSDPVSGGLKAGEELGDDTRFLYDVVAREQERVVQNCDAIDNALIAIAVGIVAAALFAGDRFAELQPDDRCAAFFLLGEAALATIGGYVSRPPDFGRLDGFLVDFATSPLMATVVAIEGLTSASGVSRAIRAVKRNCAVVATVLVVTAGFVIIVGRAHGMHG